jgi:hypothetical protein
MWLLVYLLLALLELQKYWFAVVEALALEALEVLADIFMILRQSYRLEH